MPRLDDGNDLAAAADGAFVVRQLGSAPQIPTDEIGACNNCRSAEFEDFAVSQDYEFASCGNVFRFVRCRHCGLAWLHNRPALSELSRIYSDEHSGYRNYRDYLGSFIASMRDRVQAGKIDVFRRYAGTQAVIADVGCGEGVLLHLLRRRGPSGWTLIGVEFLEEFANALRADGFLALQGRFETLEWDAPAPDVIIMNQVIEHLEDPQAVAARARELLKPGGVFIVETPCLGSWDQRLFRDRWWGGWHTPRHWHLFTEETLRQTFERQGLVVEEITYLLNPWAWLQSLRFWLGRGVGWPRLGELFQVNSLPMVSAATAVDFVQRSLTGKTSNIRIVGRKEG